MNKIRALTVDDEPIARLGLRREIERDVELTLVAECAHGREAVEAIRTLQPDLVVLDLQLPELDGFGVVNEVGVEQMPALIFATAYDQHALRAFEAHAIDYVLKPFDSARMQKALARAKKQIQSRGLEQLSERLRQLLESERTEGERAQSARLDSARLDGARPARPLERIVVKHAGRISFLNVSEVDWIEAADNYVQLHAGRDTHLVLGTLSRLEASLSSEQFLRVHRSAIVNLARIASLQPLLHGEYRIQLVTGAELTSGRTYRARLEQLISSSF
jgi:two-component system LytT family response regulator